MGFSEGTRRPRDASSIVTQLHALLQNAGIEPPYVLVAHSIAGQYAMLFADRYRNDVAGMVLVDPTPPHIDQRTAAAAPADKNTIASAIPFFRECYRAASHNDDKELYSNCLPTREQIKQRCAQGGTAMCAFDEVQVHQRRRPVFWYDALGELSALESIDAVELQRGRRSYGSMPLIVLTSTTNMVDPHVPVDQQKAEWKIWKQMHDEIADLSSVGVNIVVADSGHYIQFERPTAVISAVWEVVNQSRHRGP
jgi:pimeloyl-ACP methyl ester carboxylesterase